MWFVFFKPCVCVCVWDFGWNDDSGLSGGELQLRQYQFKSPSRHAEV